MLKGCESLIARKSATLFAPPHTASKNLIIVSGPNSLKAFDLKSGAQPWEFRGEFPECSGPVDDRIYATVDEDKGEMRCLYVIDASTGNARKLYEEPNFPK